MAQKPLFYIYGRKEMAVLMLLGIAVALFAFTLGIHLGKKVGLQSAAHLQSSTEQQKVGTAETQEDRVPDRLELAEQNKKAKAAGDSVLNQALHDEVARTGIQLDTPRQVRLPDEVETPTQGATTLRSQTKQSGTKKMAKSTNQVQKPSKKFVLRKNPSGRFTIQIGSHPSSDLAKEHLAGMEALGMEAFVREAKVKGRPWFRVYVGGYSSAREAKERGNQYKKQNVIDSFVVSQMPSM